ncbi:lipase family protein [Streptomyces lydicus]|uniref:lipase family protein n=1 Tax=Streptomyces lydicus TaxID=47763 RepID=UPI003434C90B
MKNTTQQHLPRPRRLSRGVATGAALLLTALTTAPAVAAAQPLPARQTETARPATAQGTAARTAARRGSLLSLTPLGRQHRSRIVDQARQTGLDARTARHDVANYRLTYRTITADGRPTTASGLLSLPLGTGRHRLPAVVHAHGTLAYRGYAPSVADGLDRTVSMLYASAGRAAVAPDYLGLGTGPGRHPYMDARSAGSASLDMLRAARTATSRLGATLDRRVSLTGFSQGGQVAMELARELGRGADPRFRPGTVAPVGGPFDLDGSELPGMFDGRVSPRSAVFYVSFFLTAQNRLHPLYRSPREVFRAPYADRVEALFDGEHSAEKIAGKLPGRLEDLLTDTWYQKLRHPSGALLTVLRANDRTCDWTPARGVRITLYTAGGDHDVPMANSISCAKELRAHGARPTVVDQGADADHFTSFRRSQPSLARDLPRTR